MEAFWTNIVLLFDVEYRAAIFEWIFSGVRVADPVQGAYYRPILV